jgi:hypothetical protein
MKRLYLSALVMLALSLEAAETSLVDQLPQNGLQSAFQILRRDYIRRDDLTFEELNRGALQGVLERLNYGAELIETNKPIAPAKPYVHAEFLASDIAYLRPETFSEGEAALFVTELGRLTEQKAKHLILDLRATKAPGLFEEAALMLQCFVPAGEVLFKMKQMGRDEAELYVSKGEPMWLGEVVVLIDESTNNAAECLGGALRQRGRALLIGEKTHGAAVRYAETKLDDKITLRYASAEMLLPDGGSLFRVGLQPTHPVISSKAEKDKVFAGSRGKNMKPFVLDKVRPRFNERALVAIKNPEMDDYVRRSNGQPLPGDEGQVRDVVVQRALDLISANDFKNQAKINWSTQILPVEATQDHVLKALPANP